MIVGTYVQIQRRIIRESKSAVVIATAFARLMPLCLLVCVACSSVGEAKQTAPSQRVLIAKKQVIPQKVTPPPFSKKAVVPLVSKKASPIVIAKKKAQPILVATSKKIQPAVPVKRPLLPKPAPRPKVSLPIKPLLPIKAPIPTKPALQTKVPLPTKSASPTKALVSASPKVSLPIKPSPRPKVSLPTKPSSAVKVLVPTKPALQTKASLSTKPPLRLKASVPPKPSSRPKVSLPTKTTSILKVPVPTKPTLQTKISLPTKPSSVVKVLVPTKPMLRPQVSLPPKPLSHLSQLDSYTRRNAELVGLPPLYSENRLGKGRTIAVIESSGTWKTLREEIKNPLSCLTKAQKENYKNNFLPAIGGPDFHPEEPNDFLRWKMSRDNAQSHGVEVSSVILELAPHAKVLPVSTYHAPCSSQLYDVAHALMTLSRRPEVNIINISAGHVGFTVTGEDVLDEKGHYLFRVHKTIYTPRFVEAFKAVARAGKVVVFAAGNEAEEIRPPQFARDSDELWSEMLGHLVDTLDSESLKSLVIAGYLDPETCKTNPNSNRPGPWKKAQDRFLFAPAYHKLPYVRNDEVVQGSSFAAPLICAALADLTSTTCSRKPLTPRKAVEALLNTAAPRAEKHIYGRGLMRVDRAAKRLEEEVFLPRGK